MSKNEFIRKYRDALVAGFLTGYFTDIHCGTLAKGQRAIEIVPEVPKILSQMYDDLHPAPEPAAETKVEPAKSGTAPSRGTPPQQARPNQPQR